MKPFDVNKAKPGDVVVAPSGVRYLFVGMSRQNGNAVIETDGPVAILRSMPANLLTIPTVKKTEWGVRFADGSLSKLRHSKIDAHAYSFNFEPPGVVCEITWEE